MTNAHTDSFLLRQMMLVILTQCCSEGFCWDGCGRRLQRKLSLPRASCWLSFNLQMEQWPNWWRVWKASEVSHWVPKLTQPHFLKGPCHGDDGNSVTPKEKNARRWHSPRGAFGSAENVKGSSVLHELFSKPRRDLPSCNIAPARPLGVSCNMDSMPIVVGELPQGEAYTAGVREGWVLCQVGNDPSNMRWLGWKCRKSVKRWQGWQRFWTSCRVSDVSCSLFPVFLEVDRCSCNLPGSQKNTPHFQELSSLSGRTLRFGAGGWENLTFRTKCLGSWETEKMEHLHSGNLT